MSDKDNIFAAGAAYVDGEFVPMAEARIPLGDLGFIRSDCTYDVVHVWKGRFFRLDTHIDRFLASAAKLHLTVPLARGELEAMLHGLVARTGLTDAYVNMTVTRGPLPSGTRDPMACRNRLYAFAIPFMWIARPEEADRGIAMIVAAPERISMKSFDQTVKNFMWGDLTAAMIEAGEKGAKIPVLLDADGNITEGPGFNVFVVKGGALATPDTGVLHGITRKTAIELANNLNVETRIGPVKLDELRGADEIFITSTAGGVMPVATLDGRPVGDGEPGPVAQRLRSLYWQAHADSRYSEPVRYERVEAAE